MRRAHWPLRLALLALVVAAVYPVSAWADMDDAARAADPHAGKTFDLGITVNGRFEPGFKL